MTSDRPPATHSLRTQRARPLQGEVAAMGDAAIAARALVVGAMAMGETRLKALPQRGEARAVALAVQALGARLEAEGDQHVLSGLGAGGLLAPRLPIWLTATGEAAPLLLGAAGMQPFETSFSPAAEPAPAVAAALDALGIAHALDGETLRVRGPRMPVPGPCPAPTVGAADAVLMAGVATAGLTTATGVPPGADHTIAVLTAFGANIAVEEVGDGRRNVSIEGLPELTATEATIPGDPLETAIWLILGTVVAGSQLEVANVLLNPWRAALAQALLDMGADLRMAAQEQALGEPAANLVVRHAPLTGIGVDPARTALVGEALPFLVLAAAFASGDTVIEEVDLPREEGEWGAAMLRGLSANGVQWSLEGDTLTIHGQGRITGGGLIPAHPDPRISAMFLCMGLATRDPVTIVDDRPLMARFPTLTETLAALGARIKREG